MKYDKLSFHVASLFKFIFILILGGAIYLSSLSFPVFAAQATEETTEDSENPTDSSQNNVDNPTDNSQNNADNPTDSRQTNTENATDGSQNNAASLPLSAPSVLLMDAATGKILYELDSNKELKPASVTKIMTLLLIFEALDRGQIHLEDSVTVSEHAAGMGGSQVFLEAGEIQTVETMIKCIAVASANDAAVAMSEFVAGSEEEFVNQMNNRAAELGMEHTHFVNCCGLDTDGHYTTARDIALMSRELIINHPQIHDYTTIWQENITHTTAKGSKEFTLTNTNKLIRQYEYATGLKTGSTSLAKYCVSATAQKNGLNLIAVIMAAPDYKVRFADAVTLLEYGFANFYLYEDTDRQTLPDLPVTKGVSKTVRLEYKGTFKTLLESSQPENSITVTPELPESVSAPIKKGDTAGYLHYYCNDTELGKIPIVYGESVEKARLRDHFQALFQKYTGA
ncbi:MAG: D-alanyl-D-alanine carboxypeptidase [Eubacterium sp.]|nr:D-alanyl-D-alanine carboxypeptidase [Eubacterium sp.]